MKTIPMISVIMPAYNAANYIVPSIRSVLAQSFSDFELIVIDDCSRDNTAELVRELAETDPRIRLLRMGSNFGRPAGPRNRAVREARGEWIAFLDSDDIWHERKLELQMRALAETGAQFCSSQMLDFLDGTEPRLPDVDRPGLERITFLRQLLKFRTPTSSVVARRDLLLRHPFNEDARYKAREDMDCWLRCHEEIGTSIKLRAPLLAYRIIPGQISGNKWVMVKRHHFVLRRYRLSSGRSLGLRAAFFTFSHFLLALVYQRANRGL